MTRSFKVWSILWRLRRPFPTVINCRWKKCLKRMHHALNWGKKRRLKTDMKMPIGNDFFYSVRADFIQFFPVEVFILLICFVTSRKFCKNIKLVEYIYIFVFPPFYFFRFFRSIICVIFQVFFYINAGDSLKHLQFLQCFIVMVHFIIGQP